MTKVQIREKGTEPLDDAIHYEVGSNGVFFCISNQMYSASVPFFGSDKDREISDLLKLRKTCSWRLPKIPADQFAQIVRFFREVQKKHETEVAVMLHFDFTNKKWLVTVPEQTVSAAHVHYDMTERVDGYRCVGTMHSHVRMSAGHSWTDEHDEEVFDGLHVTIGHCHKYPEFSMDAEVDVRKEVFPAPSATIIEGVQFIGDGLEIEPQRQSQYGGVYNYRPWRSSTTHRLLLPPKSVPEIPREWWKRVKVRTFTSTFTRGKDRLFGNDDGNDNESGGNYGGYGGYGSDFST